MILKNGLIIENNKLIKKDILIVDGKILEIRDEINGDDVIDCTNLLIMPGAVDVHVHLREPGYEYKETIKTGTLSAAKGGVTTIMPMPNLNPCPDTLEHLNVQLEKLKTDSLVNAYPYASVTVAEKGNQASDLDDLCKEVYGITDDGVGVNNIRLLINGMQKAKEYDVVMASHAEDLVDSKLPQGEYVAVRREIEYAKKIGCRYHFCHMSTKESFDAIRQAHKEGYTNITCEVAPHHLLLNETMIKNGNWKMNPPLRSEENRLASIEALLDGTACMIASDHAPHGEEEKAQTYEKCPNGIIGLETMIPLIYTNFIKNEKATHEDFLNWLVYNPIKIFGLPERKLAVGYPADITVLDIETVREYRREEIVSLGKNSPFIGMKMTGFPKYTLVNGKIVWRDINE